jgi:hypothetical protein
VAQVEETMSGQGGSQGVTFTSGIWQEASLNHEPKPDPQIQFKAQGINSRNEQNSILVPLNWMEIYCWLQI